MVKLKKGEREAGGECLIGADTQNIAYLSIVVTQHKTKQKRVGRLLIRVKVQRHADAY